MQEMRRWWMGLVLVGGLGALVLIRRGRGERSEPALPAAAPSELDDIFDEFPETDNPEVVRLFLAWKLTERLGGADAVDVRLARFGSLYRQIRRLTR